MVYGGINRLFSLPPGPLVDVRAPRWADGRRAAVASAGTVAYDAGAYRGVVINTPDKRSNRA